MQWRVKETNRYRQSFHGLINLFKVILLIRQNLLKGFFAFFLRLCTDHFTESINSALAEEHMLGTAKTDTLCTEFTGFSGVSRCICIGTNTHSTVLVRPTHNTSEFTGNSCINGWNNTCINLAC